jgi:hypothetical protein
MKCNILSWNVRGLNCPDKRLMVRNLLRQWRVDVVCLQETKLEHISRRVVKSVWGCRYVDWCYVAAFGAAGGILLMWDKRVVSRVDAVVGEFVAACSFKNVVDGFAWAFAGVYGPNGDIDRRCLWDELAGLMSYWDLPWCIGGDFNIVRFPSERSGGRRINGAMREFSEFISECGLMDLPLNGGVCTWSNTRSWSRIDRFLISLDWEEKYPEALQKRLLCLCSDHFPIVLSCGRNKGGRKSFKFENMWLKEEGFVDKVRGWWESYNYQGSPSFIFAKKLKALKGDIINWNKTVFGNVGVLIKERTDELKALESAAERGGLNEEQRERKRILCRDLERALLQEISWRQKSRIKWLKEGDKCTKFFHLMANSNKRYNTIDSLHIDGAMSSDSEAIREHAINYFKSMFAESMSWRPKLDDLEFESLSEDEAASLEAPFLEKEVKDVIFGMDGDKAPSPDGFSLAFFQACWEVLKYDIMAVFSDFHACGKFEKSLNSTFISLIPKLPGATELKDFRPISLVSGIYKIISKVLANRLRLVLSRIISTPQNAFVKGRQILDSVLIASESLDFRLKSGEPGLLCKLDMEKAYDHVSWDFLLYMLRRCGFGQKWCSWIAFCISTASFSVLINGSPAGFFNSSRGVRQGDPLSPFLFVIIKEAFSRMVKASVEHGLFSGFVVGGRGSEQIHILHLLFADDTLIFTGASQMQVQTISNLLICFEVVSGLKVNLAKSLLVPVGEVSNIDILAEILGCEVGSLPITYLGMPLGARFKDKACWNGVVEKSMRTLATWKRSYLSKGGRVALIKSTLSNLPTYLLSLLPIPVTVAKRIESIQCDFLWGGMGEEFKFHLVNWRKVCSPIREGGLGIHNLRSFNRALLGKWLWRYANEPEAWWRKVVEAKYGSERGGWRSKVGTGSHGRGLWKYISKEWRHFSYHTRLTPGDGSRISFWGEAWCDNVPLLEVYPGLYSLASNKEASIADNFDSVSGSRQWNISFVRSLNDWEVDDLVSLYSLLYTFNWGHGADKIWWVPNKKGKFEVKSFYSILNSSISFHFPWKSIWRTKAPPRVAFFVWSAALGKILTLDNLKRRNIVLVNRCGMCKKEEESIDHLLLHCERAQFLWNAFFSRFGLAWVMPRRVVDLLHCWWSVGRPRSAAVWKMVPLCIMWCLWVERNGRFFEDSERSSEDLLHFFFITLFTWAAAWLAPTVITFSDFLYLFSSPL